MTLPERYTADIGNTWTKFSKEEKLISWNHKHVEKVEDIFLPRLSSRGFSAQTTVPEKEHKEALQYALEAADKRFGEGWRKYSVSFTEGDMVATVFTKGE